MTTTQAATQLGVSRRTVQRWCGQGMIAVTWRPSRGGYHERVITPHALRQAVRRWHHIRSVIAARGTARKDGA